MTANRESYEGVDTPIQDDQVRGRDEQSEKRSRSQQRDRNFVRRALRRGIAPHEIEDQLLAVTGFQRLNPEDDPIAYVKGLIEEEEGSARGIDSGKDAAIHPTGAHADAKTTGHRFRSETVAQRFIRENFEGEDWLAVVVRNRGNGETIQRISTAQRISTYEFQAWLRHKNANGSDVYLSLNTLKQHSHGRTKRDLKEIRHFYLDLDENGQRNLAAIYESAAIPPPNYVLQTSPGKYQVIWRVEKVSPNDAEDLLRRLAQTFGGDPAATDATRVFRLPGFSNKKYADNVPVKLAPGARAEPVYHRSDFKIEPITRSSENSERSTPSASTAINKDRRHTQSERDWAYAIRHLRRGENPERIIREIASYRSGDHSESVDGADSSGLKKTNPRYYAERTVARAMSHLGMVPNSATHQSRSGQSEPDR